METHRAMRGGRQAEQGLHHFRTTGADQTVKTDNLTAPQTETDVVKFRRMRKMLYLQHDGGTFVVHRRARRKNLSDLAADIKATNCASLISASAPAAMKRPSRSTV